jgi:hypothetical protein
MARQRAGQLGRAVDLREADALTLPFPTRPSTPWSAPSRCAPSLARRPRSARLPGVLRLGGLLLLADHIAGAAWPVRAAKRAIEAITVPLQGEHFTRRPLRQVRAEGLKVIRRERFKLGLIERLAARKPAPG